MKLFLNAFCLLFSAFLLVAGMCLLPSPDPLRVALAGWCLLCGAVVPAALFDGARRTVLLFCVLGLLVVFGCGIAMVSGYMPEPKANAGLVLMFSAGLVLFLVYLDHLTSRPKLPDPGLSWHWAAMRAVREQASFHWIATRKPAGR